MCFIWDTGPWLLVIMMALEFRNILEHSGNNNSFKSCYSKKKKKKLMHLEKLTFSYLENLPVLNFITQPCQGSYNTE